MGALTAVIERKAEVAPLDSYAFALLSRHVPDLTAQVRPIMRTEPTPVPLLVASGPVPSAVGAAFLAARDKPAVVALMDQLLLDRFARPEHGAYDELKERFLAMRAFWRRHPLARTAHPLFAAEFEGS
jgi:ABC-type phosphate/phosphonate transport system substrate-binding protein